jgi:hypothetical protein
LGAFQVVKKNGPKAVSKTGVILVFPQILRYPGKMWSGYNSRRASLVLFQNVSVKPLIYSWYAAPL